VTWIDFEQGVEARSGQGCPAIYKVRQSDASRPERSFDTALGKTSVPARNKPRQDPLIHKYARI
jgi:hypothetical protein